MTRRAERGFALLIVLWTLVLVSLIVAHIMAAARQETQLASNLRSDAELGAAADGAVYEAIFHALDKSAGHWSADNIAHRIAGPRGELDIRIRSEAGKVNLNTAPAELLRALLHETGLDQAAAEQIAGAIVVWRMQPGQAPSMAAAYRQAGRGYEPPGAPFESVRELGEVLGVTPEILDRMAPHLTVYHDGDTDPSVADPVVLLALRDVYGTVPTGSRSGPDESVVEITVSATRRGARAGRQAIVRLGAAPAGGRLYQILDWRTVF